MAGTITGKHILWDVSLTVNGVNLSDRVESVTFEGSAGASRADGYGDGQQYSAPTGKLVISDPVVTFYQDFATAKVYQTLYAAWAASTTFNLVGKASAGAKAPTNPEWTIPVFVGKMPFMVGKRGDRHMAPVTFTVAGLLTVATS